MFPSEKILDLVESLKKRDTQAADSILKEMTKIAEKRGATNVAQRLRHVYSLPYTKATESSTTRPSSNTISIGPSEGLYEIRKPKVMRDDIILSKSNIEIMDEIIHAHKNRSLLAKHNVPVESRVLLHGPPGTGKTLFAYVLARELNLMVMHVSIDRLVSSFLGETGKNLSKIFDEAESGGYLVLLDEFDAIAKNRDDNLELGELKRVVTVLLQNLDNLSSDVPIVAATNHAHLLDSAVKRRFAYEMNLSYLDKDARTSLFKVFLSDIKATSLPYDEFAVASDGLSGAQIRILTNKALRKWVFSKEKGILRNYLFDEMLRYISTKEPFDTKNPEQVSKLVAAAKAARSLDKRNYTYSHLESITNISDSTLHHLMSQEAK